MNIQNFILLIFTLICISACSESKENFNREITSYKGRSIEDLVAAWGPPRASFVNQDQSKVFQWVQGGGSTHYPGASYPWIGAQSHAYAPWNHALWPAWFGGFYAPGASMFVSRPMHLDRSCTLNITTDSNNLILNHNAIGEGCIL